MSNLIVPEQYDRWQHRAIRETGGNQTQLGVYVLAILGLQHGRKPPRLGSTAKIDVNGMLISNMQNAEGKMFRDVTLDSVQEVVDNFRRFADHLKLADVEREEMFAELRKWIVHDARANATPEERGLS